MRLPTSFVLSKSDRPSSWCRSFRIKEENTDE